MFVSLTLKNYRNLSDLTLTGLTSNVVISGANGQGKSNILEAIYLATTGRSFRPMNALTEVIGDNGDFAKVELITDGGEALEMITALSKSRISRKYILNTKQRSVGIISSRFPVLLFAPHSVDLVSNEPQVRRDDLDTFLSALNSDYRASFNRYQKVLKNRNALLKAIREKKAGRTELLYWTDELLKLAEKIYIARLKFFVDIRPFLKNAATQLYGGDFVDNFAIHYIPASVGGDVENRGNTEEKGDQENRNSLHGEYGDILREKFSSNIEKEIIVGKTLYGPHKDDYELLLASRNLRYQGSRGQQRLGALLLKLAEWEFMHTMTGKQALFLIDDLMSELDPIHREETAEFLISAPFQFLLTTADKREIPKILINKSVGIEFNLD